jgi:hypothetical protein
MCRIEKALTKLCIKLNTYGTDQSFLRVNRKVTKNKTMTMKNGDE